MTAIYEKNPIFKHKIKKVKFNHYSANYLKWMNDKKVLEFTEQKYRKHTKKDILDFIRTKQISKLESLWNFSKVKK